MNWKALWDLTRFDHEILLGLGVIVGMVLASPDLSLPPISILVLAVLSTVFIGAASFAFNDYMDLSTDKKNKRTDRPLVKGLISPKIAVWITTIGLPLGCIFAYFINITVFKIAIAYAVLAFLYSIWLKKIAIFGNLYIASSMAVPFIFGNYVVRANMFDPIIILAAMAFLLGFGREIIKSIQDIKGDKKTGRQTLPILIGSKISAYIASYFMLFAVVVAFLPFIYIPQYRFDLYYLIPIIVASLLTVYSVYYGIKLQKFNEIRKWTIYTMLLALVGFLLGAII
jgi:geranylgeranylglycerol-phosphate geranylgeranyltransferase